MVSLPTETSPTATESGSHQQGAHNKDSGKDWHTSLDESAHLRLFRCFFLAPILVKSLPVVMDIVDLADEFVQSQKLGKVFIEVVLCEVARQVVLHQR